MVVYLEHFIFKIFKSDCPRNMKKEIEKLFFNYEFIGFLSFFHFPLQAAYISLAPFCLTQNLRKIRKNDLFKETSHKKHITKSIFEVLKQ